MAELALLDPLAVDREVRAAVHQLAKAREAFATGQPDEAPSPFAGRRPVASKMSYDELASFESDLLFAGLRRWIGALTLARVTLDDEEDVARAFIAADHHVETSKVPVSARDAFHDLLREPSTSAKRPLLARALVASTAETGALARKRRERRAEAVRLLGADPTALPGDEVAKQAAAVMRAVLEASGFPSGKPFEAVLDTALARDATEGWPAALSPRWVADIFKRGQLLDGVRFDMPRFAAPLGGSSFARALAAFGESVALADVAPGMPFVLARSPIDLLGPRRAALFGSLPAEPAFGRVVLGLGRDRAREQARRLARGLAVDVALQALRFLVGRTLVLPVDAAVDAFEELTASTFGEPWPRSLAGVVPRDRPDDASRLVGLLLGASDRARLRDEFDEDWFANPRAYEELRHAHHSLAPVGVDATFGETLAKGADDLLVWLREVHA